MLEKKNLYCNNATKIISKNKHDYAAQIKKWQEENNLCKAFKRYRKYIQKIQLTEAFCKKGVLRNFAKFTGKQLRQSLFLIKQAEAWNVINKETPAQVFSCEFNKISKNIFFIEHLRVTASQDTQGSCAVAKTKSGDIHPLPYGHNT